MVISNRLADIIAWLASIFTPNVVAVTLYPFIFVKRGCITPSLLNHENVHIEQYKRYWIVGFIPLYIYYHTRYGYKYNPLELEAMDRRNYVIK